jgi:16S rRNA (uracil1498-N3)-methyltransferase
MPTFAAMQLFYVTNINGEFAHFDEIEARHCVQVLRKKEGDFVHFIDGKGGFYKGEIDETGKKKCVVKILDHQPDFAKRNFHLHIAIAPTKNIARLEWFLEKTTEIGIDEITPILCDHSERTKIRLDRLQKVLISAMKQSLKAKLPKLNEPQKLDAFIKQIDKDNQELYIAHCADGEKNDLKHNYQKGKNVLVLIGPEGDFSNREIQLAFEHDFSSITLGESRLRTETAGIVACTYLNFMN